MTVLALDPPGQKPMTAGNIAMAAITSRLPEIWLISLLDESNSQVTKQATTVRKVARNQDVTRQKRQRTSSGLLLTVTGSISS